MQKRHILCWLIFFLMTCNTLVILSMDMAIVSMVNFQEITENSNQPNNIICPNTTFFLTSFLDNKIEIKPSYHFQQQSGYDWSKKEQNMVLSGYYWLNYLSILPASILAQKYGSKKVVGLTQGLSSAISFIIPLLADHGFFIVACARAVQGLLSTMAVPAGMYTIIGNWSPPQERGTFGSAIVVGSNFGYAVGNFCFGYIAEYIHWHYIFHASGICGLIWLILWYLLIYDTPQIHPTLTCAEREYIENSLQKSNIQEKDSIPWKNIITSIPVITCILSIDSANWCFIMIATYLPLYLKTIYGLTSKEIGVINSFPLLISCIVVLITGYTSDRLIKKNILTLNMSRRTCTFIGCIIAMFPLIIIAFMRCNINIVIICIFLYFGLRGCGVFGPFIGLIDISPKFCGILEGIAGTCGSVITFLFTSTISHLINTAETEDFWKIVFTFTGSFAIVMNFLYMIFGSTKVQKWNIDESVQEKRTKF